MNGNIDDNTYTRPEVQDIINKNPGHTFMLCSTVANSAWQTPAESGFTVQVNKPKPPAPPPAMSAPPSLPQPVAAPVLPAMASTPPPVVSATNAASTVSALTDEERAEHAKLKSQFDAGTLPTADLMKFVQYVNRIEKA
jgi:hypothetical protein